MTNLPTVSIRILHIISDDVSTGTAKQLDLIANGHRDDGHDVRICNLLRRGRTGVRFPSFGGKLSSCTLHWGTDPTVVARLFRRIADYRPDLVHTWGARGNVFGGLATMCEGGRPFVCSLRSADARRPSAHDRVHRWVSARAARIVANGRHIQASYAGRGIEKGAIEVIPNGVAIPSDRFSSAHSLRREIGATEPAVLLGVVGDLRPCKRLRDAVWAVDLLRFIRPDVHLVIVGEGEDRNRLEEYIRRVSSTRHVHFLGHRDDVPELLSQFACLWHVGEREGCSNSLLEAMATGLPVIATDIAGHRETVRHGVTGLLVPLGDRAEFARKTNLLLADPDRARRLGDAGRRHVANCFSVESMIDRYRELYEGCLVSARAAAAA